MKRIYIAVLLLLISVSLGIFETVNVRQSSQMCIDYIDEINKTLDDGRTDKAAVLCKKADEEFESFSKDYMFCYYVHKGLEDIGSNLSAMYEYLRHDEVNDYYAVSVMTRKQLESMRDSEKINLQNVL